ncbi:MAG: helix-turn-helix domain-containing protein [Acidimicrobiia bacterium]
MPERSFGRSVRYRRTKLGLSQAQLGELVGRSASSIRSWERDVSTPTDASVIIALSAILDLDQKSLFEKAGTEMPTEGTQPTVEEALASLTPLPIDMPTTAPEDRVPQRDVRAEPEAPAELERVSPPDPDLGLEAEVLEHPGPDDEPASEQHDGLEAESDDLFEPFSIRPEPNRHVDREPDEPAEAFTRRHPERVGAAAMRNTPEPAFISPPEPYRITAPVPPVVEPSYMEDTEQRQLYRVRNLATVVLFVGLVIVLLWSLSNAVEALGDWWDGFFGSLRL